MNEINEDELFLDAVDHIVLEALTAIGDKPQARFAFFGRLLAVAMAAAGLPPRTSGPVSPARMS